jgi:Zn-dependent M28 family amino/carboxypeptidase
MAVCLVLLGICVWILIGCRAAERELEQTFDGELAYGHVLAQCEIGPRHVGTQGSRETVAYIQQTLADEGIKGTARTFTYEGVPLRNVVGKLAEGQGPIVILGAHFDTRRYADRDPQTPKAPVPGGNDGASGVAVLLELARSLDREALENEIWLTFFDGEDQGGIDGWPWSVGARYMAENLTVEPAYVVIVDMIGDADQQIYWEHNSDPALQVYIWDLAHELGYGDYFIREYKYHIIDDHIPFVERGLIAADLIDLDYPYWHTTEDTADKVSAASLARVGRTLEHMLEERPYRPGATPSE